MPVISVAGSPVRRPVLSKLSAYARGANSSIARATSAAVIFFIIVVFISADNTPFRLKGHFYIIFRLFVQTNIYN